MKNPGFEPLAVLIADDDDDDYLIFKMALVEMSFHVEVSRALNGENLMQMLKEKTPDILFLDLVMPCKNGHGCLKEIRSNRHFDVMPVIIYSSLEDNVTIDKCYAAGSNFYIVKPVSINDLKQNLQHVLQINWKTPLYIPPATSYVLRNSG